MRSPTPLQQQATHRACATAQSPALAPLVPPTQDTHALSLAQRLATWFLIAHTWAPELAPRNPFTACLLAAAADGRAHPAERNLCLQLLHEQPQLEQALQQEQPQQGQGQEPCLQPEGSAAGGGSLRPLGQQTPLQYILARSTPFLDAGPLDVAALEQRHQAG